MNLSEAAFRTSISSLMPIAIGSSPYSPMRFCGINIEISDANRLTPRSDAIPTYCPRIICHVGKLRLAKNTMRINKSSILVATNAPTPIPIISSRATITITHSSEHVVLGDSYYYLMLEYQ